MEKEGNILIVKRFVFILEVVMMNVDEKVVI